MGMIETSRRGGTEDISISSAAVHFSWRTRLNGVASEVVLIDSGWGLRAVFMMVMI